MCSLNPILLNIEIMIHVSHLHWSSKILTNLPNSLTRLTLGSRKITKKNNLDHQI